MTDRSDASSATEVSTDLRSTDQMLMFLVGLGPMSVAVVWHLFQGGAG